MSSTAEVRRQLLALVRDLEPDRLSGDDAARVVADLAVIEKAAATGRMFAALRVAKTDAWRGHGHGSAADSEDPAGRGEVHSDLTPASGLLTEDR